MITLDVSFGIFAFMPLGWLFMAFVIACECFVISKLLLGKWTNKRVFLAVSGTNIISGLLGIILSLKLNGGWYLVVWFPWVSRREVNIHDPEQRNGLIIFYLISFVLTLLVEIFTNILFLRKRFKTRSIIRATVIGNIVTYAVGSLVLYSLSFLG